MRRHFILSWLPLALLSSIALAFALTHADQPRQSLWLLLAAAALGLTGGVSSLCLGIAISPQYGSEWSILALAAGSLVYTGVRRPPWADLRSESLAVLIASMALVPFGPGLPLWARALLVVDLYLPLARTVPFWRRLGICLAALVFPAVDLQGWLSIVAWLPLAALVSAEPGAAGMTKAPPSTENKPVSDRREAELASCRSELEKSRHDYSQLQEATTRLGSCSNLTACLETLVDHVHALVDCQSSVVFLDREGRLTPETYRSPYRDALGNAHLTGLSDDLAEQAWASRALAVAQDRDLSPLFAQEACAAALPLGELGILYAGRARGYPFTSHELRLLALLASQAALAASWLLIREEQSRALKLYQESCQRLEHWSKGLSRLVEGAAEMNSSLDPDQILDALVDQVLAQVDESSLALFLDGEVVRAFPPGLSRSFAERTAPQLEQLQQVGKPLALDARWSSLQEGEESLLFVPFLSNGALLLGQRPRDAFPRQQSDLISMLATQASVALEKARTHRELQLALERLKESEMALIQGSKMAAVGELAAGVAHELNTPLGSILLGAEGALDCLERNPARACQSLEMVVSACLKTRDIVAKLLYYSREARAEQMLSDLNEVVRDTLGLYEHQLRLSGLAVVCELADLPEVPLCPNEIQQVLVNLLLNARDALAPTGGTAWVRTRHASPWVELEIEDSGPGIEASVALRIFEPFYTTKPVGKGTGLGLSVSRRILERHGGTLSLASSTGGARFVLSLPERCDSATIG